MFGKAKHSRVILGLCAFTVVAIAAVAVLESSPGTLGLALADSTAHVEGDYSSHLQNVHSMDVSAIAQEAEARELGVNLDNQANGVKPYMQQNGITWPQIHEAGGLESPPSQTFGIISLPTMFLVGKDGIVQSRPASMEDVKAALPELLGLKKPTAAAATVNPPAGNSGSLTISASIECPVCWF